MARQIKNQSEFAYKLSAGIAYNTSGQLKFSTPSDQIWGVLKIIVEAPPLALVSIQYKEETTGNTVTLDNMYAYEFPLSFKPTATDTRLMLWEDRDLLVNITNPYGSTIKPRAGIEYVKNYRANGAKTGGK